MTKHRQHASGWTKGYRAEEPSRSVLRCARCGTMRPIEDFRLLAHGSRASYCRDCQLEATRQWRAENRDAIAARRRAQYATKDRRARGLVTHAERYLRDHPARARLCRWCEQPFDTHTTAVYCKASCRRQDRQAQSEGRPDKPLRRRILDRDGWFCYLCMGDIPKSVDWGDPLYGTVDHVVPRVAGGSDSEDNLAAAHWCCNRAKGTNPAPGSATFWLHPAHASAVA